MTEAPVTAVEPWDGRAAFWRPTTHGRARNALIRRLKPPKPRQAPLYIMVFQVRPKGTSHHSNRFFVFPYIARSHDELSAVLTLAGDFNYIYKFRPEFRDRQRWKVSASYENARVWLNRQRTTQAEWEALDK